MINKKIFPPLALAIIILFAILIGGSLWWQNNTNNSVPSEKQFEKPGPEKNWLDEESENNKACPLDAKTCSDGSSVGRIAPDCEFAPCPVAKAESVKANVYVNNDYGFQIAIPDGYADWKAMIEKDYGGPGVTYIHLIFKTNDPQRKNMAEENFVTHEKYPGYSSVFAFTVWTKAAYAKAKKDCQTNMTPDCPQKSIGENDKYIFEMSLGNGIPPSDLEGLRKMLDSQEAVEKILDFTLLH